MSTTVSFVFCVYMYVNSNTNLHSYMLHTIHVTSQWKTVGPKTRPAHK
jgi:hypothetical protein